MRGPASSCSVTKPDLWRSRQGTGQLPVLPSVSSVSCVWSWHTTACRRMLLPLTGLEKAWTKRDSLLPHHPSPCPTPSLSFCELKYLQSKEMPSRVNKGGAAPVVGGAQRWAGPSPGLHLFVLQLSRTHLCGRGFPIGAGSPGGPGSHPSGACLSLWVCIFRINTRDHVISQSKPPSTFRCTLCNR